MATLPFIGPAIKHRQPMTGARMIIVACSAAFALFLVWASLARVDEVGPALAQHLLEQAVELAPQRPVPGGDLGIAGGGFDDGAQQRAVALVDRDGLAGGLAHDRGGVARRGGLGQRPLGGVELVDGGPARAHEQVAEVVEVAVEDRAPEAGALHHLADAQLVVGAIAHEFGRRGDDAVATLLAGMAQLRLPGGHLSGAYRDC